MNRYIESLKSFLIGQTLCFGFDDADSILEMLYYYYTVANPVDHAVIRCQFKELHDVLCHLTLEEGESIFAIAIVGDLCVSHERQAFLNGIHVGMRLFSELNELPEYNSNMAPENPAAIRKTSCFPLRIVL